ncbi:hypothetical protein NAP1_10203 [Erythrobacter sp. NAP1]|uniref:Swt1 family HEPN domain-containing protein n=1 Tax=Erythrobacter sp. NAP1 TaxID=237727 RepID=UPI000068761A|nr:Swt1 family HEPN domain-containing protein [Erythrobacter sp. NAP1]EAQ27958.1 hypothetical protein NAP1_10203 [Erythrobacter sp. NAP1]
MPSTNRNVRLFGLNNLAIEASVRHLEKLHEVDLGHGEDSVSQPDETYYPQFDATIRSEAAAMAVHYRVFYCLENSIRTLISDILLEQHGTDWWNLAVPPNVKDHAEATHKRELESGISVRSEELIDYTTFGELGEIIKTNWETFSDIFQNIKALEKVISTLNTLRGPIAHCKTLAEDEVVRLHLALRDWFRAMG